MIQSLEHLTMLHKQLLKDTYFDYEREHTIGLDLVTVMGALSLLSAKSSYKKTPLEIIIPVFHVKIWEKQKPLLQTIFEKENTPRYTIQFCEMDQSVTEDFSYQLYLPTNHSLALIQPTIDSLASMNEKIKNDGPRDFLFMERYKMDKQKKKDFLSFIRIHVNDSSLITEWKPTDFPSLRNNHFHYYFLYVAIVVASAFFNNGKKVYLFQNGIEQLFFEKRKGLPHWDISLFQSLLNNIALPITIENPFANYTLGEVIQTMDKQYKGWIKHTTHCTRRKKQSSGLPCGICSACLFRKISLASYNSELYDGLYQFDYGIREKDIEKEEDKKFLVNQLEELSDWIDCLSSKRTDNSEENQREKKLLSTFISEYQSFINKYHF